jgi:hypothetical protein
MNDRATSEALLCGLPSMLQASGASLEEIDVPGMRDPLSPEGAAGIAQILRRCSSTLKTVKLATGSPACERELVAGLTSCCDTLEVLHCDPRLFSALPATCPGFPRLTELQVGGRGDKDVDFIPRVLDIITTGRLPALADLSISSDSDSLMISLLDVWAEGGGCRLGRALEAVAGTLLRLTLSCSRGDDLPDAACYELGAAIGKLRRLRFLSLYLFSDGWGYAAVGWGLAVSGGCPGLFELRLSGLKKNLEWLTREPSLILRSVRNLQISTTCSEDGAEEEPLLLFCALVEAGYKYLLEIRVWGHTLAGLDAPVRACMRAILGWGGINAEVY